MSLTGPWFFVLLLAVTAMAFVALIVAWARWAGPGRSAAATRVALLAGVNALVLLTAAVGLNNQYLFYADWTDVGGAVGLTENPAPGRAHIGGDARAAAADRFTTRGLTANLPSLPPQIAPGARLARFRVPGRISGIQADVVVFLPTGYTEPAQSRRRYPVVEGFPGYPGGPLNPSQGVAAAVTAHRLADPIILAPVIQVPTGRDTECVNGSPADPQVETWLTRDLPDWAAHTLRVRTDRASWATVGWSVGGWCAAMAAMLHPDQYGAAIVLGGYFQPLFGQGYRPFGPNSAQGRRYDLVSLAAGHPPAVALWVQTSRADPLSYPSSSQLLARARAPLSIQSLVLADAGHRISVWKPLLSQAFAWLGSTVPGFAPDPAGAPGGGSSTQAGSGTGGPDSPLDRARRTGRSGSGAPGMPGTPGAPGAPGLPGGPPQRGRLPSPHPSVQGPGPSPATGSTAGVTAPLR
jgi:enterochelin esterase-like enzyme